MSRIKIHRFSYAAPVLFFAALTFVILAAIVLHTNTHTAGYDFFNYNWNFWFIRHVFSTPGLSVYENNFVFAPVMSNYGYHALTAFWYPVWALFEPLIGTLAAVNVILALGCFLNGYLLYLLLRSEGVHPLPALIGGAALQTLPIARYFYYNTHLNLMDWFWLPGLLLLWKQIVAQVEARRIPALLLWAVIFGVALWGLLLTDLQFPIFAAFVVVPYGAATLVRLLRQRHWDRAAWVIGAGILAVIVGVALMWFAGPLPYIIRFQGELTPGSVEDRPGIPFPMGFLSMAAEWWQWSQPSTGAFVTVALILALILSLSRWRKVMPPDRWFWFWLMLPPFVLAMGPTTTIGDTAIPLPYRLMHELTNGMFRMPWRLAPIGVIAGAVFAGKVITPLVPRLNRPVRVFAFAVTFLLLAISIRLFESAPIQPVPTHYAFYEAMGREPYDYVVLEVPTGAGTGEVLLGNADAIQLQYYGIIHQKRMVNGFVSRAPIDDFWYIHAEDPMLAWLGQRRLLEPAVVEAQFRERIASYPIGYVVIHTERIGIETPTVQEIVGYFNQLDDLLCPYTVEGAAIVYRTTWHPDGCSDRTPPEIEAGVYQIDIGTPDDARYIGWGYHWREDVSGISLRWTGAYPQTDTYLDLPPADYEFTAALQAFWEERTVRLRVNGVDVGDPVNVSTAGLADYTWTIPADALGAGHHVQITLVYDAVVVPAEVGQSADQRRLAVAIDRLTFARR
ncbi:MAG: hypothetical protein IAE80_07600 [Anaerolinea sp.]|nr:hypothetical protein [Anaerolinea sp.]